MQDASGRTCQQAIDQANQELADVKRAYKWVDQVERA